MSISDVSATEQRGERQGRILRKPSPPSPKSLDFRGTNFLRSTEPYGGGSKCVCATRVVVVESGDEVPEMGAYSLTGCGRLCNKLLAILRYPTICAGSRILGHTGEAALRNKMAILFIGIQCAETTM